VTFSVGEKALRAKTNNGRASALPLFVFETLNDVYDLYQLENQI
jgi:hypothetical protein